MLLQYISMILYIYIVETTEPTHLNTNGIDFLVESADSI